MNATRAAEARAAEASARAADVEARLDAETRLSQTKISVSQNTIEALRATIATLESDLELARLPANAETHLDVPGLGPFAFPLVPLALEKAVPGENAKKTAAKLRELIRDFRRAAAAADVTLEYSKGLVDRVRASARWREPTRRTRSRAASPSSTRSRRRTPLSRRWARVS